MAKPLRVAISLSTGASLGAYQAGATAASSVAVRHLAEEEGIDARIDAFGGASAGAIVGLVAAHALVEGIDPVWLLRDVWVDQLSVAALSGRGLAAPLDLERARGRLVDRLDPRDERGRRAHRTDPQAGPVALHVALTGLQGLTYPIGGERGDRSDRGTTYVDWARFALQPGGGLRQLREPEGRAPLDVVAASASHPGAFAPWLLDRRDDEDGYLRHGIEDFPASGHLWYTDGGLLQARPLAGMLEAARALADGGRGVRRLALMVDARSEGPSGSRRWSDPDRPASWLDGLSRSLAILPAQVLYDELREIEADNARLERCERLADALAPHLDEGVLEDLPGAEPAADARARLLAALHELCGVRREEQVTVDVISPVLLEDQRDGSIPDLLAGELMGDFGGFLSRELRASDFALGFESAVVWLERHLSAAGDLPQEAARRAARAAAARRPHSWNEVRRGRAGFGDLPPRDRVTAVRLALRFVLALVGEALPRRRS